MARVVVVGDVEPIPNGGFRVPMIRSPFLAGGKKMGGGKKVIEEYKIGKWTDDMPYPVGTRSFREDEGAVVFVRETGFTEANRGT